MNTPGLSFAALRAANVTRCGGAFHPIEAWSSTDWGCATAGEVGEACNIAKKLRRLDEGGADTRLPITGGPRAADTLVLARANLERDLAEEFADVAIYLDLWAARHGIDLAEAIRAKFNKVSEKRGSDVRL